MKVGILTISDGCSRGIRKDESGDILADICHSQSWEVARRAVVPDEMERIQDEVIKMTDQLHLDLVLATGGTGLGSRDVTPEAMKGILEKVLDGFGELMRHESAHHTQKAWLSRALAGTRGKSLIICLPGSPKGVWEMLGAVLPLIPHAVEILSDTPHPKK